MLAMCFKREGTRARCWCINTGVRTRSHVVCSVLHVCVSPDTHTPQLTEKRVDLVWVEFRRLVHKRELDYYDY